MDYSRRNFIRNFGLIAGGVSLGPAVQALVRNLDSKIKIGLIADLHQDIMHDGQKRLNAFLSAAQKKQTDAIIKLGDFAYPNEKNKALIDSFNAACNNPIHVIGNHDTDSGHTKEQCYNIWGMPNRYYVKDMNGLKVLVLDGNDKGSPDHKGGYPTYIGEEQFEWLREQLYKLKGPIMLASHQPLAGPWSIDNSKDIQNELSKHQDKILMAICGHTHIDGFYEVGGINYLHVNSASYQWVGGDHRHQSYSPAIHEKFPWIEYTCPYRDSVFAILTINPDKGIIEVTGIQSEWVGPDPEELGADPGEGVKVGKELVPAIRDRKIIRRFVN